MELLFELLGLLAYGSLIVVIHELGHAFFARRGGYRVTSFGIGLGAPIWSLYLRRGVVLHLDRWLFFGGACTAIPLRWPTPRRAWFHGGGLIFQMVLFVVLLPFLKVDWVFRAFIFNLLVAATNAIPWRTHGFASDGWYLLDAWSHGRRSGSVVRQRPLVSAMAAREQALNSPLGTAYSELVLAWADCVAGHPELADEWFNSEQPAVAMEPWVDVLYHYVRAEWHRLRGRPREAIAEIKQRMEAGVSEECVPLLTLAHARALVDIDQSHEAQRVLARLVGDRSPVGVQATVVWLASSLDEPTVNVEHATWRLVRASETFWLDPTDAASALEKAAIVLEEGNRPLAAAGARRVAASLVAEVLAPRKVQ